MRRVSVPECEALAKASLASGDADETAKLIEAFGASKVEKHGKKTPS
jgi:hypothetical protein